MKNEPLDKNIFNSLRETIDSESDMVLQKVTKIADKPREEELPINIKVVRSLKRRIHMFSTFHEISIKDMVATAITDYMDKIEREKK